MKAQALWIVPLLFLMATPGSSLGGIDIGRYLGKDSFKGSGDLQLRGSVDNLEIELNGAGDVDAEDLHAVNAEVEMNVVGGVSVFARDSFRGRVSGVGRIDYYGHPEKVSSKVSGMGKIRER